MNSKMIFSNYQKRHLRDKLDIFFNLSEIRSLCFDLMVDYDNLAGDTKRARLESLITYLDTRGRLQELLSVVERDRPHSIWQVGPPNDTRVPYRGLSPFREVDAPFFFGREEFAERLTKSIQHQTVLAVIGPSGSGKTSVVFAGLLPRLRQSGEWFIADFRPSSQPFIALATALIPGLEPAMTETAQLIEAHQLAEALQNRRLTLLDVVTRILSKHSRAKRLLLVADQFEELYSLCSEEVRHDFLETLLSLTDSSIAHLVLTLRADFLEQVLMYRRLADALQGSDLKLGPMTRDELRRAIEEPATRADMTFADGLMERMLADIETEPGNLPLLQFALTLLWERQENGCLTHVAYEDIGGVSGALAQYADEQYQELSNTAKAQVEWIFVQLVSPGKNTKDTRRRATKVEIGEENWHLVRWLADVRLVTTNQSETVELVHEALIQEWELLQEWLKAHRTIRLWQEQLRNDLERWQQSNRDRATLLRGTPLEEAKKWLDQPHYTLSDTEKLFIQTSLAWQKRRRFLQNAGLVISIIVAATMAFLAFTTFQTSSELAMESTHAAQNANMLATEVLIRSTAQSQAQSESTRAILNEATAVANAEARATEISIRSTAEVQALEAQMEAESQLNISRARELAALALNNLDYDPELSALLALQAFSMVEHEEARESIVQVEEALYHAVRTLPLQYPLEEQKEATNSIIFSPDGTLLAASNSDGKVRVWDARTRALIYTIEYPAPLIYLAIHPDNSLLVATAPLEEYYEGYQVIIWNLATSQIIKQIDVLWRSQDVRGSFDEIKFIDNGSILNIGIRRWDTATFSELPIVPTKGGIADAYSHNGMLIAVSSLSGQVEIWNADSSQLFLTINAHERAVSDVTFSLDDRFLATAGRDGLIKVWDLFTGREVQMLTGHTSVVTSVAFDPSGNLLVSGSLDGTTKVWNWRSGSLVNNLPNGDRRINYVSFSPDGTHIAIGTGTVGSIGYQVVSSAVQYTDSGIVTSKLWDFNQSSSLPSFYSSLSSITKIMFSADNDRLLAVGLDDDAKFWDLDSGGNLFTFSHRRLSDNHPLPVQNIALSQDGNKLATIFSDGIVKIWDSISGINLVEIILPGYSRSSLDFNAVAFEIDNDNWKDRSRIQAYPQLGRGFPSELTFSSDGAKIVIAHSRGITVYDSTSGEPLLSYPRYAWRTLFSLNGERVVWLESDQYIVYAAEQGTEIFRLSDIEPSVIPIVLSPNGQLLLVANAEGIMEVWVTDTGERIQTLPSMIDTRYYEGSAIPAAFSFDNSILATIDLNGQVQLWDIETGNELHKPLGFSSQATSVAFCPSNKCLATGHADGFVRLQTLGIDDLVDLANLRLTRTFTPQECDEFLNLGSCP